MSTWEEIAVPDALLDTSVGKQHQVLAQDIAPTGAYPVIDQGQSFIAGYCDDPSRVIDFALPVIIFGDHTRAFKYVDFPFVLGADGTKVLKPDPEQFDARYFYFAMLALDIPNRGYNRHFKILRERSIPKPPLPEQQRIAQVLSTVQEAIAQQERLIRTTTELKQALMQKLFTEGLRGEALKETEIGMVPESWEVVKLEEFCQRPDGLIQTGPFGSQLHSHEYTSEGIPVVNPTHLSGNRINHEDVPRVPKEVADRLGRHYVQLGDILFARRGEIGRHGLVGKAEVGWLCGTGCFLVRANDPRLNNEYLSYFCSIKPVVDWLNSHAAGAIMPNLSTSVIANLPVGLPPLDEQRQIFEAFNALEQKLDQAEQKRTKLQDLFRTLLHELMTGKVRVNELN